MRDDNGEGVFKGKGNREGTMLYIWRTGSKIRSMPFRLVVFIQY